jgi:DNA polymerase-1
MIKRNNFFVQAKSAEKSWDFAKVEQIVARNLNRTVDVHAETAALVFNVPIREVTPEMRRASKALDYGVMYSL